MGCASKVIKTVVIAVVVCIALVAILGGGLAAINKVAPAQVTLGGRGGVLHVATPLAQIESDVRVEEDDNGDYAVAHTLKPGRKYPGSIAGCLGVGTVKYAFLYEKDGTITETNTNTPVEARAKFLTVSNACGTYAVAKIIYNNGREALLEPINPPQEQ